MNWNRLLPVLFAIIGGCTERPLPASEPSATVRQELRGATRLRDIDTRPSRFPSLPAYVGGAADVARLRRFTTSSGVTYLTLSDGLHGGELWRSDGTESGTVLVKDVYPGLSSSEPGNFVEAGGRVFFVARSDFAETGLWKTDGTGKGTVQVKHFRTSDSFLDTGLRSIAAAGTRVVFTYGDQLWGSDGTAAGTVLLMQHSQAFSPDALVSLGDRAFFILDGTLSEGLSLWRTDGTKAGTARVSTLLPAGLEPVPRSSLVGMGGVLWFSVRQDLWKTDGTEAGTVLFNSPGGTIERVMATSGLLYFFVDGALSVFTGERTGDVLNRETSRSIQQLVAVGDTLYFTRTSEDATLPELWRSDGTPIGTFPVGDLWPGAARGLPERLVVWNGQLFFVAATTEGRAGLWKSDGTWRGTVVLTDWPSAWPLAEDTARSWPTPVGTRLLFGVPDAQGTQAVWRTDGTVAGTASLTGVRRGTEGSQVQNVPFGVVDGKLLFAARDGASGWGLWKSDGTEAGTALLRRFQVVEPQDLPRAAQALRVGSRLFFTANDGVRGRELWVSDGTEAGTLLLRDILPGTGSSVPLQLTESGGVLYFTADDGVRGDYLWMSDGTEAGTVPLSDSGWIVNLNPALLTSLNGSLYFTSFASGPQALWKTDGTLEGTVRVMNAGSFISAMMAGGGSLYFVQLEREGASLWKSDGTEAGTARLLEVPGSFGEMKWLGDRLYFTVFLPDSLTFMPWTSDGTPEGTVRLADPSRGGTPLRPLNFERLGDRVFFLGWDAEHGYELWKTDGTPAGTERVLDLGPGAVSGVPVDYRQPVESLGGVPLEDLGLLLFVGRDAESGVEPWVTDGTREGTRRLADLRPGPASSHPSGFARVGSRIFFFAGDDETGREPFALPLPERNAPQLTCPANVSVTTDAVDGDTVAYPAATVNDESGDVEVGYSQASGSRFPVGTTAVEVTATDTFGNQSRCSFSVEVTRKAGTSPPPPEEEESGCGCTAGLAPAASASWGLLLLLGASLRRRRRH